MIYFDTSYLVKCYVNEEGSDAVQDLARRSERIACSAFGRSELYATVHRNLRTGDAIHICSARRGGIAQIYSHDRHMLAAAQRFGMPAADILL